MLRQQHWRRAARKTDAFAQIVKFLLFANVCCTYVCVCMCVLMTLQSQDSAVDGAGLDLDGASTEYKKDS